MENLAEAIRQGLILLDSDSHDMDDVLLDVVQRCVSAEIIPSATQESVLERLQDREALDSTAIGRGVAIPHAYVDGDIRPTVVFVRLKHPLDVRAIDGEPARYLFILIGTTGQVDDHLNTLASIALAMSDNELRYDLREAGSSEEILQAFDGFMQRQLPHLAETRPPEQDVPASTGSLFGGITQDIQRRLPHLASDFTDGFSRRTLTAVVFLYFSCLTPAILFGGLMHNFTGGQIGAAEMLVATAGCGVVFALLAGQPLIILGGTGPLLVFTGILWRLCIALGIPFLETWAWVGLWTAAFTLLLAFTDASSLIRHCTRFTEEIFGALIALLFIGEAVGRMIGYLQDARSPDGARDVAFLSLILAVGTFITAMLLSRLRRSRYAFPQVREFLSDFGPTLAVLLLLLFSLLFPAANLSTLSVPDSLSPSSGRHWIISPFDAPVWVWLAAAVPAIPAAVLVFLDQNITARLVNSTEHRLRKGAGYHLDLAIVGGLIGICALTGLPWLVAATVRSLNHVRALATVEERITPRGDRRDEIVHTRETRVTGLIVHLLIGLSLLILLPYLDIIPEALLYGLLLYMGVVSIGSSQLFQRASLWATDPSLYPRTHYIRKVPMQIIHQFTLLQVGCLVVLWIVQASPLAVLLPVFIAMLVLVRILATGYFSEDHLAALDAAQLPAEEDESEWT